MFVRSVFEKENEGSDWLSSQTVDYVISVSSLNLFIDGRGAGGRQWTETRLLEDNNQNETELIQW